MHVYTLTNADLGDVSFRSVCVGASQFSSNLTAVPLVDKSSEHYPVSWCFTITFFLYRNWKEHVDILSPWFYHCHKLSIIKGLGVLYIDIIKKTSGRWLFVIQTTITWGQCVINATSWVKPHHVIHNIIIIIFMTLI